MAITLDHIHLEGIAPETGPGHADPKDYVTVTFRVLERGHPNSFVIPVSVHRAQFDGSDIADQARYVFHHLVRTLARTTQEWEALGRPGGGS